MNVNYNSDGYENARIKYYDILASDKRFKKQRCVWSKDDQEMLKVLMYSQNKYSDYQMEKYFDRDRKAITERMRLLARERLADLYKLKAEDEMKKRIEDLQDVIKEITFLKKELNL